MAFLTINSSSQHTANNSNIADQMNPDATMIVLDKFQVSTFLYESVQFHLNEILPHLLKGGVYNSQELLGETFWADMDMPRHLPLMCLKHLAQQPGSHLIVSPFSDGGTTYFETN